MKNNKLCFNSIENSYASVTVEELSRKYYTESEFKYAFTKKYGSSIYQLIKEDKIRIGAPSVILLYVYGKPDDINKSTGSWGVHEQWVYRSYDVYIYVENGKITSWQN